MTSVRIVAGEAAGLARAAAARLISLPYSDWSKGGALAVASGAVWAETGQSRSGGGRRGSAVDWTLVVVAACVW